MNNFYTVNILDLIETVGEEETKVILSDFKCSINSEIEEFLHKSAIEFAKRKMSITYLVIDNIGQVIAYFTLTHKPALVPSRLLSNNSKKKIERHARMDEETKSYIVSAFLIAQLGKNEQYPEKIRYSGMDLMDQAINILKCVQRKVGGGIVFLECEDNEKLLKFYQSEHNNFGIYGERIAESEHTRYKQLLRFF